MDTYKKQLIDEQIIPFFNQPSTDEKLVNSLYAMCHLHTAIGRQILERPGSFEDGRMWFSVNSMVQAYYYCKNKQCKWGTRIWKKREFAIDSSSFLHQEPRTDYIEILEAGEVLSIAFTDLIKLMDAHPVVKAKVQEITACNERYYHYRTQLLNKPPLQRVQEFEAQNPLFIKVAGKEAVAMHVSLTRQGYYAQLKKMAFAEMD